MHVRLNLVEEVDDMAHDVFVSYSHKDKPVADAVVAGLENRGIRCWFAPRDITPGRSWGEEIIKAIEGSHIMVIILSGNSNRSSQVVREVERAVAHNVIIIPFRIENIDPTGAMAYYLSTEHWLDAIKPPIGKHIEKLIDTIQVFQSSEEVRQPEPQWNITTKPTSKFSWMTAFSVLAIVIMIGLAVFALPRLFSSSTLNSDGFSPEMRETPTEALTVTAASTPEPTSLPTFSVIGSWPSAHKAQHVFIQGTTAYIANGGGGLIILDVSDPTKPSEIGSYPLANAQNVLVIGDFAFVVEQDETSSPSASGDRLILLDIKIPAVPRLLGEFTLGRRSIQNFAVEDQIVYLTRSDRLIAIDIADPLQMETIGEFSFYSNVAYPGVAVKEGIVYLLANKLHIVDFRNPTEPIEITSVDTGWGSSINLIDQIAYVTSWDEGLTILDMSDPAKPTKLGRFMELVGDFDRLPTGANSRQTFMDASVSGETAYLSFTFGLDQGTWIQTLESGVLAIDISNPAAPVMYAKFSEIDNVSSIFATEDLVYVTDSSRGLLILTRPK